MPRAKLILPGNGLSGTRPAETILRFLKKVRVVGPCWIWKAARDENDYGRFFFRGRSRGAHRVSYFLFVDDIPPYMDVDHHLPTCSHSCVNPEHLRLLTRLENSSDGGSRNGSSHAHAQDTSDSIPI